MPSPGTSVSGPGRDQVARVPHPGQEGHVLGEPRVPEQRVPLRCGRAGAVQQGHPRLAALIRAALGGAARRAGRAAPGGAAPGRVAPARLPSPGPRPGAPPGCSRPVRGGPRGRDTCRGPRASPARTPARAATGSANRSQPVCVSVTSVWRVRLGEGDLDVGGLVRRPARMPAEREGGRRFPEVGRAPYGGVAAGRPLHDLPVGEPDRAAGPDRRSGPPAATTGRSAR